MQKDPDLVTVARVARTFRTDPLPWLLGATPGQLEVLVAAHNAVVTDERDLAERAKERARERADKRHNSERW